MLKRIPFLTGLILLAIIAVVWAAGSTYTNTRVSKWGISDSNLTGVAMSGTSTIDDTIIGATTPAAGKFTTLNVTGVTTLDTGLTVGGGTQIDMIKMYTFTLDATSVDSQSSNEQDVTVNGLTNSDFVFINPWTAMETGLGIGSVRVKAPNTLAIQFINATVANIDPASRQYDIVVFSKH